MRRVKSNTEHPSSCKDIPIGMIKAEYPQLFYAMPSDFVADTVKLKIAYGHQLLPQYEKMMKK
jgi:hypothetical protein